MLISANSYANNIVIAEKRTEEDAESKISSSENLINAFFKAKGEKVDDLTEVKVSYDAKNIYFDIKCREPNIGKLRHKAKGQDNNLIWGDDIVEIFLSPSFSNPKVDGNRASVP